MAKITLNDVADLTSFTTAVAVINANSVAIETAMENTLSRDGTQPNTMSADLDMNSNRILNLPAPASVGEPARLVDVVTNPTITVPPVGTSGAVVGLLNANKTDSGNNTFSGTNTFVTQAVGDNSTKAATTAFVLANSGILSTSTVTGATTTYTSAQRSTFVKRSNSGAAMSDLLPGTGPGILTANTSITIQNVDTTGILSIKAGAGAVISSYVSSTGFIYIGPGQTITFYSDGSNYWTTDRPAYCKLAAPITIFIATTGSATNDGLTVSTPLLDPTFAYNLIQSNFDLNKVTLTFKLADGAYGPIQMNGPVLGAFFDRYTFGVAWVGNAATPANVTLTLSATNPPALGAIQATNNATGSFSGFTVASATVDNIAVYYNSQISIQNIIFKGGRAGGMHMICVANSLIMIVGNYTINPTTTAGCHMIAIDGAVIEILNFTGTTTVTLTGTPAFVSGFAGVQYPSNIVINTAVTYSGAATGPRYIGTFNGTINTAGGGANFFPGNSVGVLSTGAQYN